MIIRFGGKSVGKVQSTIIFHDMDMAILTSATCMGYLIIVSAVLANYIMGASVSFLEVIINGLAVILFAAIAITLFVKNYLLAIAVIALVTAVVFAVDLCWLLTYTKFGSNI